MLYCLLLITKTTFNVPMPVTLDKIIFCENNFLIEKPHEYPNFQRYLYLPNIFFEKNRVIFKQVSVHFFNRKNTQNVVRLHLKLSSWSVNWTRNNRCNICVHLLHLLSSKVLLKVMFIGCDANTFSTITFLWLTVL
jgi:hypothetical protein